MQKNPNVSSVNIQTLNGNAPLGLFKVSCGEKAAFYSRDCHTESGSDSDCLSVWFFVRGNMLSAGLKTYCSVTTKYTVN